MKYYITVDGGTTNTRVTLVKNGDALKTVRISLGARASINDPHALPTALRNAIAALLQEFCLTESDVTRILASGMITSEFGLCSLPHVQAPAGIRELQDSMHEITLTEISAIPFVFIRGIKSVGDTVAETDIMRGEETELMGLLPSAPTQNTLYVLPGSHSKLIETDECGRIFRFSTMLTGEMIAALSEGTILKDAIDLSCKDQDHTYLLDGCRYAMERGINEALFKVRILKNLFSRSPKEIYSFFLGAVLASEIQSILQSPTPRVVIGGKAQIKHATETLLKELSDKEIVTVSDADVDRSSSRGAIRIYEYQK